MRRNDDVVAGDRVAGRLDRQRIVHDSSDSVCSKTCEPSPSTSAASAARYLRGWKRACPANSTPGRLKKRHRVEKPCVEPELRRERRLLLQPRRFFLRVCRQRRELVARDPLPVTVDRIRSRRSCRSPQSRRDPHPRPPAHDRGRSRSTSAVRSRSVTHVTCAVVCPVSTPPTRSRSITATVCPRALQQIRGRQASDARAHDRDIHAQIAVEGRKSRHVRRVLPVGFPIQLSGGVSSFHVYHSYRSAGPSAGPINISPTVDRSKRLARHANGPPPRAVEFGGQSGAARPERSWRRSACGVEAARRVQGTPPIKR